MKDWRRYDFRVPEIPLEGIKERMHNPDYIGHYILSCIGASIHHVNTDTVMSEKDKAETVGELLNGAMTYIQTLEN